MSTIPESIRAASELAARVHSAAIVANWGRHAQMTTSDYRRAFREEIARQDVAEKDRRFVYNRCCAMSGFGA